MKRLFALLLLLPGLTAAQSDFSVTWSIPEGLNVGGVIYTRVDLDLDIGNRYYPVNGGIATASNVITPATGTCFDSAIGGIYCNIQADQFSFNLNISSNLNGTIDGKDSLGNIFAQHTLLIEDVY